MRTGLRLIAFKTMACRLPPAACRLPPAVHVPRPRNKRASVQRAAQAVSAASTGHALAIA